MIINNYVLRCEEASDDANRLILFEVDEDTGAKMVVDIVETDNTKHGIKVLSGWFVEQINDSHSTFALAEEHDDVDLGRARKMETKIRKVLESL